jgi:hypothetical protein
LFFGVEGVADEAAEFDYSGVPGDVDFLSVAGFFFD